MTRRLRRDGYGCWPTHVPESALEKRAQVVHLVPHPRYPCGDQIQAEVWGQYAVDWAEADQTIMGETWAGTGDPGYAYAILLNVPDLVRRLETEGYALDTTRYPRATHCALCRERRR